MQVRWRLTAIQSIKELDKWRARIELPPIRQFLKDTVQFYFEKQDFSVFIPGRQVATRGEAAAIMLRIISIIDA